jgi:hypothetical protein
MTIWNKRSGKDQENNKKIGFSAQKPVCPCCFGARPCLAILFVRASALPMLVLELVLRTQHFLEKLKKVSSMPVLQLLKHARASSQAAYK